MSYIYSVLASIGNKAEFSAAHSDWALNHYEALGASSFSATEVVMGGELSGACVIGFEYPTIDAAMAGQAGFYRDPKLVQLMQDAQVSIVRRNLFRVQAERGERTGAYGTILYLQGTPVDDATMNSNIELNWNHIQHGANGLTWLLSVASGPSPFNGTVVTWTDSIDSLMSASAKNFSDPAVLKVMAETNTHVIGRVICRNML